MADGYLIDAETAEARRRLELLQALDDPATIVCLEAVGVRTGWRCLEIGAGGGSITAWLCRQVGEEGKVVAIDLNARFLRELEFANLEVREQNIAAAALEEGAFDLVHGRSVLMHIPEREAVLSKLARAVRPGGWILVEESDSASDGPEPSASSKSQALYRRVIAAVYDFVRERGFDPDYGQGLDRRLETLGFEEIRCESVAHSFRGGTEPRSPHMPALREIKNLVVARGDVTAAEYDDFLALEDDPTFRWQESTLVSAWGRKPEARP